MIKLGVNSVLFAGYDYSTAAACIAASGYDGIEISAIKGMCEHLPLNNWKEHADDLKEITAENGLEFLSMEAATLDDDRLTKAFEAGAALGIPVVNVGPGGDSDVEEDFQKQTDILAERAQKAEKYGITLCVKAHVGAAIYNTPTTLRAMEKIQSPAFGIDMDPSHIYRSGEKPDEALRQVVSRVKHIHIRDCPDRGPKPGKPPFQSCGRGEIDLPAYCQALVDGKYSGPVCLEVIGAKELELSRVCIIAAESYGYLNACFSRLGAR